LLLAFSASIPFSVSSLSIRWELSLRVFAMLRTCAATLTGRLMLAGTVCRPHSIGTADSPGAPDRRFASQFDASTSELQRWQFLSPARILDSAKEEFEKEAPEESMASLEVTVDEVSPRTTGVCPLCFGEFTTSSIVAADLLATRKPLLYSSPIPPLCVKIGSAVGEDYPPALTEPLRLGFSTLTLERIDSYETPAPA